MSTPLVRIGEIAEQLRGVTYSKGDASPAPRPGFLPIVRAGNISDEGLNFTDLVYVPASKVSEKQMLIRDDVVIAASSGSLEVVGKAAQLVDNFEGGFGAFCKVLRPNGRVNPRYFLHFFKTQDYRRRISFLAEGANINNLRREHLNNLELPLPPLDLQKHLADILDRVDALRAKRREALAYLDDLAQSIFSEIFGNVVTNERSWNESKLLSDVADVASGITKGRAVGQAATRTVPYLAVANVQDMRLDLRLVKKIDATETEVDRYRLQRNDLLLTEGGDPDKLGRGVLWRGEIPECIHQNHIFRVRLKKDSKISPVFLNWLISSPKGRSYFLRCAKQTTGIASINATQLRNFPVLVPPTDVQERFTEALSKIEQQRRTQRAHLAELNSLFEVLQYRAFRGEL